MRPSPDTAPARAGAEVLRQLRKAQIRIGLCRAMAAPALRRALIALGVLAAPAAAAADCGTGEFEGRPFTACVVDPATEDLRLFHRDADGAVLGSFGRVADSLAPGERLALATNAGMYHLDRSPVGLYREDRVETRGLVTTAGPGNFGLLPNGVLCLTDGAASVVETRAFAADPPPCRDATQSGPMLVIDGALHPRFLPDGTSRNIRNGVGVRDDGRVVIAISDTPVTFHEFARLFRDHLGTPDALYLDGRISRLYAPVLGRRDIGLPMGPILGVVARD